MDLLSYGRTNLARECAKNYFIIREGGTLMISIITLITPDFLHIKADKTAMLYEG